MKIRQNAKHFAYRKALETPGIRSVAKGGLVSLHTRIFLKRAEEGRQEERREHLDAFFEGTVDAYLAALQEGYSEAEAREITHVQANFDFFNHGWTEMMEFPVDEVEAHYERHREFFQRHGITIDDPLGEFEPAGGVPAAPSTPEKLDDPEHPHAEGGFADDVYVDTGEEVLEGEGQAEPEDVDPTDVAEVDADASDADADATDEDAADDSTPEGDESAADEGVDGPVTTGEGSGNLHKVGEEE